MRTPPERARPCKGKPMADRRDFFRQIADQYRQLAEIAGNPEIKQRMLDMAATYQAKADEDYERVQRWTIINPQN
jgi:hypothetical protein